MMTKKRVIEFYENRDTATAIGTQINHFLAEHPHIADDFEIKYAMTTKPDGEIITAALLIYEETVPICSLSGATND